MDLPTYAEVGHALGVLGHYRVERCQEVMYPYKPISASVMLALGFRESGLRNICGGATWDGTKWVQSFSDRGYLQISDKYDAEFLKSTEGCDNGKWVPSVPPVNALTDMHVPRFTYATLYVKAEMEGAYNYAKGKQFKDPVRFAVAAHNAGAGGAEKGYKEGDVDKYTAHGDYSAYVMGTAPLVHEWIVNHPTWVYHAK